MTVFEIAALSTLVTACGGIILGVVKIIAGQKAAAEQVKQKDSILPAPDHGPCNESVNRLTESVNRLTEMLRDDVKEQRAFRSDFSEWMAFERGRRDGADSALRRTGEIPVPP